MGELFTQAYFVLFNLLLQVFYCFIVRFEILLKVDNFRCLQNKDQTDDQA